jgi:hypothetical protein
MLADSEEDSMTSYSYERGHPPVRDGMSVENTPIKGVVSIFSGNEKKGRWELPRYMRVLAIFGGVKIDLREAIVAPGESVIETLCIFGGIEIVVPPQLDVQCDGDAIMGAFTLHRSRKGPASLPPPRGAPVIRVIGDAYAGAVTIQLKAPREKALGHLRRKFFGR